MLNLESKLRNILKDVLPPAITRMYQHYNSTKSREWVRGNYPTWEDAKNHSSPYKTDLEIHGKQHLKWKNGVEMPKLWSFPLLSGLLYAAIEKKRLHVLDFGGNLGLKYYEFKKILSAIDDVQWCIVDLPHIYEYGRKHLEDDRIKFFKLIEDAMKQCEFDVVVFGCVLLYLDEPYELIKKISGLNFDYIFVDRTPLLGGDKERFMVQSTPAYLGEGRLALRLLSENKFVEAIGSNYLLVGEHSWKKHYPSEMDKPFADYKCLLYRSKRLG